MSTRSDGDGDAWCVLGRHMNWVDQVLPRLEGEERPLECMQLPGDVLYVPSVRPQPRPIHVLLACRVSSWLRLLVLSTRGSCIGDLIVAASVSHSPSRSALRALCSQGWYHATVNLGDTAAIAQRVNSFVNGTARELQFRSGKQLEAGLQRGDAQM